MLSSSQVETFLESVIKFANWKTVLESDPVQFLKLLVPHFAHNLYFQNVTLSSLPHEKHRVPDTQTIITAEMNGIGGPCLTQNSFIVMLLKSLGFPAYLVPGHVHGTKNPPVNHTVCIVETVHKEKYLIDLGIGLPFVEPVPLHDLPYTQMAAGYRYRYIQQRNGVYCRLQLDGALFGGEFDDISAEYIRYEFTLDAQPLEYFQRTLSLIFNNKELSPFLKCPILFRYFEEDSQGNLCDEANVGQNRKWILVRGTSVLIGSDTCREMKHYCGYDEVKHVILKYFPKLSSDEVNRAIENYKLKSRALQ